MSDVTQMLEAVQNGDKQITEALLALLYDELRKLAESQMAKESPGQTLQATALVHEAYLHLVGGKNQNWDHRGHFFAAAAEAMRRILVDRARARKSLKRGGDRDRILVDNLDLVVSVPEEKLIEIHEALEKLEQEDPVSAQLVNLRFFAGFEMKEIASILQLSSATAARRWAYARAWLAAFLDEHSASE